MFKHTYIFGSNSVTTRMYVCMNAFRTNNLTLAGKIITPRKQ